MLDKDIKNLEEIINLIKEELDKKDKNVSAILDLKDLSSLRNLIKAYKELEEERQIVGMPVRNKRDGRIGIVLHQWKSGSVAVLESINPRVINTHDSWNTLEIVTDEVKQTQIKCETIPLSLVEELKRLFYSNRLTQYGKRKLIEYYEQRIKELEEIEESHRKENGELRERIKQLEDTNKKLYEIGKEIGKQHKYTSKNYIPKSKVEEKIEELKDEICGDDEYLGNRQCIELELLEKVQKKLLEKR